MATHIYDVAIRLAALEKKVAEIEATAPWAKPEEAPSQAPEHHRPILSLVDRFATALCEKLLASEDKYGWNNGWMRDDWANDLRADIRKHIEKGDPRDVAAYCAFAWHHGWSLATPAPASWATAALRRMDEGEADHMEAEYLAALHEKLTKAYARIDMLKHDIAVASQERDAVRADLERVKAIVNERVKDLMAARTERDEWREKYEIADGLINKWGFGQEQARIAKLEADLAAAQAAPPRVELDVSKLFSVLRKSGLYGGTEESLTRAVIAYGAVPLPPIPEGDAGPKALCAVYDKTVGEQCDWEHEDELLKAARRLQWAEAVRLLRGAFPALAPLAEPVDLRGPNGGRR